ncbi:hypothetical protein GQ607_002702 [Colletotrichum asianum]|uniref:Uncharacterized protein n=1 Tax=Colletotrichum asianum TaxID=702518 RepID=A0A8H3ZYA6_9PEZI|nr:hypothetical protein GQ607_002702 [Colletotrichum asianum]
MRLGGLLLLFFCFFWWRRQGVWISYFWGLLFMQVPG